MADKKQFSEAYKQNLQATITRIIKMEQYFDEVLKLVNSHHNLLYEDANIKEKLQVLLNYYESGLWLQDYECDERGELPENLKRGVLSQDALYNLVQIGYFSDPRQSFTD